MSAVIDFEAARRERRTSERISAMTEQTITYGEPVNLTVGGAYVEMGTENRDGEHIVGMAADDGNGAVHLVLTPAEAADLADVLRKLAAEANGT